MGGNSRPSRRARFPLGLVATVTLIALSPEAWGYPIYSRYYRVRYRDQGGCNICHNEGGGTKRNPYGEDWQRSGEGLDAFAQIEQRDSDGDGASNLDEIKGGSNPGDRASTLARPGYKWHLRHQVPVPVDQIRHALGTASDYGFREADMSLDQAKQLEGIVGRPLRFDERTPTLYYALNGTRRTGATAIFVYPQLSDGRAALLVGISPGGKIRKLFLLRAGEAEVKTFRPYVDCLEKTSAAEPAACPPTKGQEANAKEILKAIQLGLATVATFPS
jgi:hypothetical protein